MTTVGVQEYNAGLKAAGKGGNSFEIKTQDDLKKRYQNFLTLLMTQLKNQDPMDPVKNEDFITQLVQFSLVEQSLRSNETQDKALSEQQLSHLMNAANFISREVEVASSAFEKVDGQEVKLGYELPKGVGYSKIMISDAQGNIVNTYEGEKAAGHHNFKWDGMGRDGELPSGKYAIEISIRDEQDNLIKGENKQNYKVPTSVYSTVQGVMMDNNVPKIKTGKDTIMPLSSILSIQSV